MFKKVFTGIPTFAAYHQAQAWLKSHGYSYGPSSHDGPCAIFKGDCVISKWRNLSAKERKAVDGILDGDIRNGPVTVHLKVAPQSEAA
ncbi:MULTISPECIES: hypothetical protein [unclassified Pseudomonas]|uniref:hypothetical protein n=1 Tax=unclassified Pseudomonas TaxID=196821 RepID=UPI000BD27440|nr:MULTISPECIES: hypothetical protein [unclassified Pseudomonas]PVZ19968.1 hypothetical protein F474_00559 [Pseudomonas sp. URIL14HWK12:I12]PVZ27034.1 hypothetical protein F470_00214 [Pseudomonas sp. URIL14HWK12:I10]PVZ37923.1 hypothetical protein F472_00559 [Pseudomonas sp. URIL14HWK12:I11]SNZ05126.1 hypothetical protein SAMN05660463_00845 [Pseudomonas sp. URIL14HWK12:I9]